MSKKRAGSEAGQTASKRMRTGKNSVENGSDISDMSSDSDGENDCSQNADFRPQEHNVSLHAVVVNVEMVLVSVYVLFCVYLTVN